MEIEVQKMISTSLKKKTTAFEEGQNLVIKVRFNEEDYKEETSSKVLAVLEEVDHHHLSEDPELKIKTYEDLALWLDERLEKKAFKPSSIQIQIDEDRSVSLF